MGSVSNRNLDFARGSVIFGARIESRCCFEFGRRRERWVKLAADADYRSVARLTLAGVMVDRIRFARGASSLRATPSSRRC